MAYDKKIDMNKEDPELILGRMRCLEALGEWYVGSSTSFKSLLQIHWCILSVFVMYNTFAL